MFTEMAACIGHAPMTDHTERELGFARWPRKGEHRASWGLGCQELRESGPFNDSRHSGHTKGIILTGRQPPTLAQGTPRKEWHLNVKRERGPF